MNYNQLSIFEKIIQRLIPGNIIYETDSIIVIKDINPQANIHFLIIPKEKFKDISDITIEKIDIIKDIFLAVKYLSNNIEDAKEYKLIINNGTKAGQSIPHLHVHFLAGY
jgi:histidine triad (HIT) family protein